MVVRKQYEQKHPRRFHWLPEEPSCRVCGETDLTKLVTDKKKPLGVIGYCRTCQRQYNIARTQKHWYVIYRIKDEGCVVCRALGREILEFHHLSDKEFNPTQYISSSTERLFKELNKCLCVCANCHRRLHAGTITTDQESLQLSYLYALLEDYENGNTPIRFG